MKKTILLPTIIAFSGFAALTSIASERSAPHSCPKASLVRTIPLNVAKSEKSSGSYLAYNINTYGTKQRWAFIIGHIDASNQGDAVSKANEALPTLTDGATKKPAYDAQSGLYYCVYNIGYGYVAGAITSTDGNAAIRAMQKFH